MVRPIAFCLAICLSHSWGGVFAQEDAVPSPTRYELMIDGESFLVEANEQVRLESKEKPGTEYTVALRVALQQPLELNSLRLEYDWPAQVQDDHGRPHRTVRVHHELGYTFLITDLGQPLEGEAQAKALEIVTESVTKSLADSAMQAIESSKPSVRQFAGGKARGVTIRYQDREGFPQACLVFVMVGEKFACSCVVQYFEKDQDTVLPRIRTMLDSIRSRR